MSKPTTPPSDGSAASPARLKFLQRLELTGPSPASSRPPGPPPTIAAAARRRQRGWSILLQAVHGVSRPVIPRLPLPPKSPTSSRPCGPPSACAATRKPLRPADRSGAAGSHPRHHHPDLSRRSLGEDGSTPTSSTNPASASAAPWIPRIRRVDILVHQPMTCPGDANVAKPTGLIPPDQAVTHAHPFRAGLVPA
jgi:hypothetical protein